jgi:hypothetical protein
MTERVWRPLYNHVTRTKKVCLETEGTVNLEVDKLIVSLGGSVSDSCDTEVEDDVRSDDRLSGIENLTWKYIET